jgi:hypothetical protein
VIYLPIEAKEKKKKKRGVALRFTWKKGLQFTAPGMKIRITRDQLMLGTATALGVAVALTPAGPMVASAFGKLASGAGKFGLTTLQKVAEFASKTGTSLSLAAKKLGYDPEQIKRELAVLRQKDPKTWEEFTDAVMTEGGRETTHYTDILGTLTSPPVLLSGVGLLTLLGIIVVRKKK